MKCQHGYDHNAIRSDDAAWSALRFTGIQHDTDDDGNPAPLELRDCSCGSTLARPAPIDTRPRVTYVLPDGTDVAIIFDHGDVHPPTITFTLIGGKIVNATRKVQS